MCSLSEAEIFQWIDRELSMRQDMAHCSVVNPPTDCYLTDENYAIVSDRCDGATLREELQETGPMNEKMVAAVVYSVMEILRMCRENRILHGDVTPEAFRLKTHQTDPFKIHDLCFAPSGWLKAHHFRNSQYIFHGGRLGSPFTPWDLPSGGRYSQRQTCPLYIAPEVFAQDYAYEADMWGLGVFTYELLTGRFPFWSSKKEALELSDTLVRKAICQQDPDFTSPPLDGASSPCLDFLYRLLQKNPYERMHVYDALQHPWICRRVKKEKVPFVGEGYLINPGLP